MRPSSDRTQSAPNAPLSIIVPVHNRLWALPRCVESVKHFASDAPTIELILVDDGSTDGSAEWLREFCKSNDATELDRLTVLLIVQPKNMGVAAARNAGARAARGDWLVFLDSDDELSGQASQLLAALQGSSETALHFFPASTRGRSAEDIEILHSVDLPLTPFCRGSLPECLPVVSRAAFKTVPYHEDIQGYESLSYLGLIKSFGPARLHSSSFRRYHIHNKGQLSDASSVAQRSSRLAVGHLRAARLTLGHVPVDVTAMFITKSAWNAIRGARYRWEVRRRSG